MQKSLGVLVAILLLVSCSGDTTVDTPPVTQPQLVWKDIRPVPHTGPLNDVWGSGPGDVFAVGYRGGVIHYDGSDWSRQDGGLPYNLGCVWGTSANNVYATGTRPIHYDGSTWSAVDLEPTASIYAVHGSSAGDVYFVGSGGTVVHFDGTDYEVVDAGVTTTILDVWSNGLADVYLISKAIHHYDGSSWNRVDLGEALPEGSVRCVAAASPDNVLATGHRTAFFDGTDWTVVEHDFQAMSVYCNGPNDYYSTSRNRVWRFDGEKWSVFFECPPGQYADLRSVWGDPDRGMYAVGSYGEIWLYRRGDLRILNGTTGNVIAVWGSSDSDVYTATHRGELFHYDGKSWREPELPGSGQRIRSIWGTDEENVFAADGYYLYHFDGAEWTRSDRSRKIHPIDMWQARDGVLFVAGGGGIAIREGLRWQFAAGGNGLNTVWGRDSRDVYAAGDRTLLHYDGERWTLVPHEMLAVHDLWGCDGEIYAAAETGLWVNRGDQWSRAPGAPLYKTTGVWGTSGRDLHLLVLNSRIFHYDGTDCEEVYQVSVGRLSSIWGVSETSVYVGGDLGLLLHYGPDGE